LGAAADAVTLPAILPDFSGFFAGIAGFSIYIEIRPFLVF
jgi:hypothetical protein